MDESSCLLPLARFNARKASRPKWSLLRSRLCVKSKAAIFILLWNFSVLLIYQGLYNTISVVQVGQPYTAVVVVYIVVCVIAVFSPLAGLLTDVKLSRYKALLCSSYGILIQLLIGGLALGISYVIITTTGTRASQSYAFVEYNGNDLAFILFFPVTIGCILLLTLVIFIVNALQFGMDQLHDSSTEDSILFIHWYVWLYYFSIVISEVAWNLMFYDSLYLKLIDTVRLIGLSLLCSIVLTTLFILIFSLCVLHHKKVWFHIEPAGVNPYKLVYKVVKFAFQHKIPVRRSAFTYCEDEFPSRLDLGKHKYGGPFTTKQVEDVKAFWGIFKVLICIGPAFMLQTVLQMTPPLFSRHGHNYYSYIIIDNVSLPNKVHPEGIVKHILISNGVLSPLIVVVCIPLYLSLIRPHISYHIPGIFKRMGMGLILMVVAFLCVLAMDVVVHKQVSDENCMFTGISNFTAIGSEEYIYNVTISSVLQNIYFFTSQHFLSAFINMIYDIAVLEFVCSQSPYSMKGLLLGFVYSIRYFFQAMAIMTIIPFGLAWTIESLSCGSGFYLTHIGIGLLELLLFLLVAKRYKYRVINEPSNEYRYAEAYYSNIQ